MLRQDKRQTAASVTRALAHDTTGCAAPPDHSRLRATSTRARRALRGDRVGRWHRLFAAMDRHTNSWTKIVATSTKGSTLSRFACSEAISARPPWGVGPQTYALRVRRTSTTTAPSSGYMMAQFRSTGSTGMKRLQFAPRTAPREDRPEGSSVLSSEPSTAVETVGLDQDISPTQAVKQRVQPGRVGVIGRLRQLGRARRCSGSGGACRACC